MICKVDLLIWIRYGEELSTSIAGNSSNEGCELSYDGAGIETDSFEDNLEDTLPFGDKDTTDCPGIPTKIKELISKFGKSKSFYKTKCKTGPIIKVINIEYFIDGERRMGSSKDVDNLKQTFEPLGFKVISLIQLSRQ